MTKVRPLECPFCSGQELEVCSNTVMCICGARGPTQQSAELAVEAWNEAALRIKQLSDALEHARDSLLWCARGGRMASHGLEQYPEKWAASATAVLEQRG